MADVCTYNTQMNGWKLDIISTYMQKNLILCQSILLYKLKLQSSVIMQNQRCNMPCAQTVSATHLHCW